MNYRYVKTSKQIRRERNLYTGFGIFVLLIIIVILVKMSEMAAANPYWNF